jgi:addiction module RelE/StbE family toxin
MTRLALELHRTFEKQLAKLPQKRRDKVIATIEQFLDDPTDPTLRNHELTGEWTGFRSISVGGDLRLHFQITDNDTVAYFVAVGSHSQLYK